MAEAEEDTLDGVARSMEARAATYSFLARALSEDEATAAFLEALRDDPPATGTELDAFAASLAGKGPDELEGVRRELAADHSATLLGMSRAPVPPYESVYTSPQRLMMQDARDEVLRAYRAAGLAKDAAYHVPEDHVSLELDFMAALARRCAEGLGERTPEGARRAEEALGAQRSFMDGHLRRWVPQLADDLEARAATPFYRGVAQLLRGLVAEDTAFLEGLAAGE